MSKKSTDCENTMQDYSSLYLKYEQMRRYAAIYSECLDIKDKLCAELRKENEELKNKLKLYEDKFAKFNTVSD